MDIKELNNLVDNILTEQIKGVIEKENKPTFFHIKLNGEPIETCEDEGTAYKKLEVYKKQHPDQELLIEPSKSKTYSDMVDELDEITEKIEESDMKNKRKVYQLTEEQLKKVVNHLVEDGVPGLTVTQGVQKQTKKENEENAKEVAAKIKKSQNFEGNDNPEFPKPIGKGDKVRRDLTDKEQDEIDANENRTPLEVEYDSEPSEQFKDRAKKALEGDSTMGNGVEDGTNAVNGDAAKKMQAVSKKKVKAQEEEPFYKKEEVPVDDEGKHKDKKHTAVNEADYRDEHGDVPGEQDTGSHEYTSDVNSSGDFMKYGHFLLKKAHGNDYNQNEANSLLQGIINDKENGKIKSWGEAVGILQQSLDENNNMLNEEIDRLKQLFKYNKKTQ